MRATVLTCLALSLLAASARGATSFSGDVCGLLSGRQVATVVTGDAACRRLAPSSSSVSAVYTGRWGGGGRRPHLLVRVVVWKSMELLGASKSHLDALPGRATPVPGIGLAAYEWSGGGLTELKLAVGTDVVTITLRSTKPPKSLRTFNALARALSKEL